MTYLLSLTDARDLQAGQLLAVTGPTAGTSLVLVRADGDLRALFVPDDLGGDFDLGQLLRVRGHRVAVHHQHRGELNGVAHVPGEPVHEGDVAHGHLLPTATGVYDRRNS